MFRIWGKIFKDNHLLQDMVYENSDPDLNRTRKVYAGLHEFCMAFDLQKPIWLEKNITEFKRSGWILRYGILRSTVKHVFIRIILLSKSNLTIWKFMSLKKIKH